MPVDITPEKWLAMEKEWKYRVGELDDGNRAVRAILEKAFRGFVVGFESQVNAQEIHRTTAYKSPEQKQTQTEVDGNTNALVFHCLAVLKQMRAIGLTQDYSYHLLGRTIRRAVDTFEGAFHLGPGMEADIPRFSKEKLFGLLNRHLSMRGTDLAR